MFKEKRLLFALLTLVCVAALALPATSQAKVSIPDDAEKNIQQAMPSEPWVKPEAARTMLIYTDAKGFKHGSIPYVARALEIMGEKTGAFDTVVSDDPSVFAPDSIKKFDAVCFDNTTGELFTDEALKKSLIDYVKSGKGVVGIHAATDCFYDWKEYGEMMGAYFDAHPWTAGTEVTVKKDEIPSTLTKNWPDEGLTTKEEIYQFKDPYSRENLRVLLKIDTEKTDMNRPNIHRKDNDFAVAWIQKYGDGRVFYCSLGHNPNIEWTPAVLNFYLGGIQYAMGDLEADATPSAKVATSSEEELAAARKELDDDLQQMKGYEFGDSRIMLTNIKDYIDKTAGHPKARAEIRGALAGILKEGELTYAAKDFICRQMALIGTAEEVPVLADLLKDEETAEIGRYALERIPAPAAGEALRAALKTTDGVTKVGVINSLGARGDEEAVPQLAELLNSSDPAIAQASAAALGRIGSNGAMDALVAKLGDSEGDLHSAVADALLTCARMAIKEGKGGQVMPVLEKLYDSSQPIWVREGALASYAAIGGEKGLDVVIGALKGDNTTLQHSALRHVRVMKAPAATKAFAGIVSDLSPDMQALMLKALADRGDAAALDVMLASIDSDNADVRVAALAGLKDVGDASVVDELAQAAATREGAEADAARESLNRVVGPDVTEKMVGMVKGADSAEVRAVVASSLGDRQAKEATGTLIAVAKNDQDAAVRTAAIEALAQVASLQQLPDLVSLVVDAKSDAEQAKAADTVVTVARDAEPGAARVAPIISAYKASDDAKDQAALLQVLGQVQEEAALDTLKTAATKGEGEVQDAAVRALVDWPSVAPIDTVLEIAKTSDNDTHKILALRGFVRMVSQQSDLPPAEALAQLKQAMDLATRDEEKKMVLQALGNVKTVDALKYVAGYLDQEAVQAEAAQAAVAIGEATYKGAPEDTKAVLNKVLEVSGDDELKKKAQSIMK